MVKKYGWYSLILLFLILGRIFVVPLLVTNENSSYVRIVRYQVLRDYPYYEIIQGKDMDSAMKVSGYPMETIIALDGLLTNSFNPEKALEAASKKMIETPQASDQGLLENTKVEIWEIYDFYHIKGIFTAILLNVIVILLLSVSLFVLMQQVMENRKAGNKRVAL